MKFDLGLPSDADAETVARELHKSIETFLNPAEAGVSAKSSSSNAAYNCGTCGIAGFCSSKSLWGSDAYGTIASKSIRMNL